MNIATFITVTFIIFKSAYAKQDIKFYSKDVRGQHYVYSNITFEHAECPVWIGDAQTLLWVDVLSQEVHSLNFITMNHLVRYIEYGEVNIVMPIQDSSRLLLAVRQSLYILDWDVPGPSGLKLLTTLDEGFPNNIVNEGKCDALGRFWVGSKGPQSGLHVLPDYGAFYTIQAPVFTPQYQLKPVTISNGLVFSLNNTVLYYIDSPTRKVDAFDFDLKTAHISGKFKSAKGVAKGRDVKVHSSSFYYWPGTGNRRTIIDLDNHPDISSNGVPDGMTIDKEGFLWVALFGGGMVLRVDPDEGVIVTEYKFPASQITSVTWAGRDLDRLVVTASKRNLNRQQLAQQPLAGVLFVLNGLGTSGVPAHKFNFPNIDSY